MKLTGKSLIADINNLTNDMQEGQYGFNGINPLNGEKLSPDFIEASEQDINCAANLANKAFMQMNGIDDYKRAIFLEAIIDEIMALGDELLERATLETALSKERMTGERARTCFQLQLFADMLREGSWVDASIDSADPNRKPLPKPDLRAMRVPLGPVVVFAASNFPLAYSVAGGDTASAFAAGCPVIVKAHPAHPGTSEMIAKAIFNAIKKCEMPNGIFSLIQGENYIVGEKLVEHPLVKAVGFTGSLRGGRALYNIATARQQPIPFYAEMGSINPVFLLDNDEHFDRENFVEDYLLSLTSGVGQFCTNPGVLILQNSQYSEDLLKLLKTKLSEIQPGTMLTKGIQTSLSKSVDQLLQYQGVELLAKGAMSDTFCGMNNRLYQVSAQNFINSPELQEEMFGPVGLVIICDSEVEMKQIAMSINGQLTASIHTSRQDCQFVEKLIARLNYVAGRVIFNGFPTGVEVCRSMVHGGPYPAATPNADTSVGHQAVYRFTRMACFQNTPQEFLPSALKNSNPLNIYRIIDGQYTNEVVNFDKNTF